MAAMRRKGLTGIETAIILIAFVIVAAAFAFAVLNVGFQSTQKAQEVIKGGMEQAASAIELDGAVIAKKDIAYTDLNGDGVIDSTETREVVAEIRFTVKLSPGQNPIDFNKGKLAVAIATGNYYNPYIYDPAVACTARQAADPCVQIVALVDDGDLFLESGEKFEVVILLPQGQPDDPATSTNESIEPNVKIIEDTNFKIEVKPVVGNVLTVDRTTPLVLSNVMNLG